MIPLSLYRAYTHLYCIKASCSEYKLLAQATAELEVRGLLTRRPARLWNAFLV